MDGNKRIAINTLFLYAKFIITIAQSAIIIPIKHLRVIFSLKNAAAINADNTNAAPEVKGYKIPDGINFADIVLK